MDEVQHVRGDEMPTNSDFDDAGQRLRSGLAIAVTSVHHIA